MRTRFIYRSEKSPTESVDNSSTLNKHMPRCIVHVFRAKPLCRKCRLHEVMNMNLMNQTTRTYIPEPEVQCAQISKDEKRTEKFGGLLYSTELMDRWKHLCGHQGRGI